MRGRRSWKMMVLTCLALLVMVSPLLTGVATSAPKVPPGARFTIHMLLDLTSAYASAHKQIYAAFTDYFRRLNEEENGIEGVKIDIAWSEFGLDVSRAITVYQRFKGRGMQLMWNAHSSTALALKSRFIEDGIVCYELSGEPKVIYPPGNTFIQGPPYADTFVAFGKWLKDTWPKWKERPPRVASLTYDLPFGKGHLIGVPHLKKLGIEYVGTEITPFIPVDLTPQLTKLIDLRADYVYMNTVWQAPAVALRDRHKLGLDKEMTITGVYWHIPDLVMELSGEEYFNNYVLTWPCALPTETNIPGVKQAMDFYKVYRAGKPGLTYFYGIGEAEQIHEALKRTIKAVGYAGLTGTNIKKYGFQTLKNFVGGGVLKVTNFSETERRGAQWIRMIEYVHGKKPKTGHFKAISDWYSCPAIVPEELK